MKKSFLYIILASVFFSCSGRYKTKTAIADIIPKSSHTIIKVNALNDFKTLSSSNSPFPEIQIDSLLNKTDILDITSPLYICISDSSSIYITKYSESLIRKDSTLNIITHKNQKNNIYKTIYNKDTLYHRIIDSLFFGSYNLKLVKEAKKEGNHELKNLLLTSNDKNLGFVVFKNKAKNALLLKDSLSSKYDIIDINVEPNTITFNGITKSSDSLFQINVFKNTIPQEFKLSEIIPANSKAVTRIAFDDFTVFSENLSHINLSSKDSIPNFLSSSNEIALVETNTGKAITIKALDESLIKESLNTNSIKEIYKGISVFNFDSPNVFNNSLKPFINLDNASFGFIYESFVVFSDNVETLKNIISNKLNNQTLSNSDKYKSINNNLANESSYLVYKDGEGLYEFLDRGAKGYNANVVQYAYDTDFAHINGVLSKYKKRAASNSVTEDFTVKLPLEILIQPQTVKNHRNNTHEIVAQDIANNLYLISSGGRILWKKQLNSSVLGKIKQIDIYKNGRLQLAFATQSRVYVIDRNGKDVGPFPMKFNDVITQPLSIFDYDNRKNYRLLVTQGKSLLMYDTNAKRVNGFKYKKASNPISSQPKHFRIGSKDYIVFSQGQKLEILNRQGQERIKINSNIDFSENSIFLYQNKFTSLNKKGQLVQVDTKGRINIKAIGLGANTKLKTTSKTLVASKENRLKIKSLIVDLDFGNYTTPKIFYLQDKIYVTTTDLQSKKVYVFDSQAKLLPNFPVFGTASAELQNLDNRRGLELITQSDDKTITVYKMN
ncbi:MAG: ribonuclease HII [Winogradskyella sp.]|nr:MAG: ribonuclease HII [Winogradskyella sp.]